MTAEFTTVANNIQCAVIKNTNNWGGDPIVCGALSGFEAKGWGIDIKQALIANGGWTGNLDPDAASPGPRTPGGTLPFDLYFQDAAWRFIAAAMGAESVANPGTGVYDHTLSSAISHVGMNLTVAALFPTLYVRQLDFAKVVGFKIMLDQAKSRSDAEVTLQCFDEQTNQGAVDADLIVVSVALANGAATIAAQPPVPQQISVTIGGTPTEAIITVRGYNEFGKAVEHVHTYTVDGASSVSDEYFRDITFVTETGVSGAGTLTVGVTAGRGNTIASMASVTKVATRSPILFHGAKVYLGLQSQAGALDSTNLINVESLELERTLNPNTRVTTEFGYKQSEPATGGAGQASTKVSLKFGALTDVNQIQMWRRRSAQQCRIFIEVKGNHLATAGYQEGLSIYLQGLQAAEADPKPSGQGVIPFDLTLQGSNVSAAPAGWPGGILSPIHLVLRNAQSGLLLA